MGKKILFAEDSAATQKFVSYVLRSRGHHVQVCGDGMEALQRYAEEPFDLVILDVMMPRMSGLDVLREIRSQYASRKTPVILLTSENRDEDQRRGIELGADRYLSKPFQPEQLLELVDKLG
ncbi:MAG: response regulator [Bdellovibrionota bacterium]